MSLQHLFWLIVLVALVQGCSGKTCNKEKWCKISRVHGMRSAACNNMEFKEFPKCISTNVEIIDLSYNRIRKVTREDLEPYSSISFLYLNDNMLTNIDEDTFAGLTNLEALDLSLNGLSKIPVTVLHLPSLKSLYLSENKNINIAESIQEAKPFTGSSLTQLDLSYITEDGSKMDFPIFDELPMLATLNMTGNHISYLTTTYFAGLCNLQIFASENVTTEYSDNCDCWRINRWLTEREVKFTPLVCPISEEACPSEKDQEIMSPDVEVYQRCKAKLHKIMSGRLWLKIGYWSGIAIGCIVAVAAIPLYLAWNSRRNKRKAEAKSASYAAMVKIKKCDINVEF